MYAHLCKIWVTENDEVEPKQLKLYDFFKNAEIKKGESVLLYLINNTNYKISNNLNDIFLYENKSRNSIQIIVNPPNDEGSKQGWIDLEFRGANDRKRTLKELALKGVNISPDVRLNF